MIDFSFYPAGVQARAMDARMRHSLADSLDHILEQSRGHFAFDEVALGCLINDMRSGGRYPPSTFALYTEIVLALCDGNNHRAQVLLSTLAAEKPLKESWRILALDDPTHAPHIARFTGLIDSDPGTRFEISAPSAEIASSFRELFRKSYELMSSALPELTTEFDALVSDVVMVVGDQQAKYQFDGGSCYMLWGGLFLNAQSHQSEVALIEVMAHESAHMFLYGCACDEALVENGDDELYPSPLRVDLRPMDGIYHATFVSARMHWAMRHLINSGLLDDAAWAFAQSACDDDEKNFWAGYGVIAEHGRLTATGSQVIQAAKDYMDSV